MKSGMGLIKQRFTEILYYCVWAQHLTSDCSESLEHQDAVDESVCWMLKAVAVDIDSGCQECVLIAGCVFRGRMSDGRCQNVGQLCTVVLVRMKVCVVHAYVWVCGETQKSETFCTENWHNSKLKVKLWHLTWIDTKNMLKEVYFDMMELDI